MTLKQISYTLIGIVALFVSTTFTSCLSSDNDSTWDFSSYVTLYTSLGASYYISDDGYRFNLTNVYAFFTGYPDRALVYIKLAEGETLTKDKVITGTIYSGAEVNSMPFIEEIDEESNFVIKEFYQNSTQYIYNWGVNGYLNLTFGFFAADSSTDLEFALYPLSADENELTLQLLQTKGGVKAGANYYASSYGTGSFKIPGILDIQSILSDHNGGTLVPANDSIDIKVIATDYSNNQIEINNTIRVKATY